MAQRRLSALSMVLLIVIVHAVLFAVFVRETWILDALSRERVVLRETFGEELAGSVQQRAERWFNEGLVDTGVVQNSFFVFLPTQPERQASAPLEGFASPLFVWFEERLRVLWALVYHALHRWSALMAWLPYAGLVLVPFLLDGLLQRRIKQTNFDYTSPAAHSLGITLVALSILATVVILTAPFAITPLAVPGLLLLVSVTIGRLAANWQKRW